MIVARGLGIKAEKIDFMLLGVSMRRYFSVAFLVLLCSHSIFATKLKGQSTPTQTTAITEGQAISIAERVIKEKNPRVKEIMQLEAKFKNDQWHIFAITGYTIGGHCSVIIDKSGNVIKYWWGE